MRSRSNLLEVDAGHFAAHLGTLAEIYALAMNAPTTEAAGRAAIMERHVGYPGFRAVIVVMPPGGDAAANGGATAPAPPAVIAFAYVFHGTDGQWWHDLVRESLTSERSSEVADYWLGDALEFAEVHVHPDHQGRGIGRRMMLHLARGRPERTAVLSTPEGQTRARRLYHSLGFANLLPGFSFPGSNPPYAIMGAELPLRDPR